MAEPLTVSSLDPQFSWMGGACSCVEKPPALLSLDLKFIYLSGVGGNPSQELLANAETTSNLSLISILSTSIEPTSDVCSYVAATALVSPISTEPICDDGSCGATSDVKSSISTE